MLCPKCKKENPEGSKFCNSCATPLNKKTNPLVVGFLLLVIGWAAWSLIGTGFIGDFIADPTFTIQVRGDDGLEFHGSYMVTVAGSSQSQSVEGRVPQDYSVSGKIVSVSFQKKAEQGSLRVALVKNGEVVKSAETSAAYGMVTAASR